MTIHPRIRVSVAEPRLDVEPRSGLIWILLREEGQALRGPGGGDVRDVNHARPYGTDAPPKMPHSIRVKLTAKAQRLP